MVTTDSYSTTTLAASEIFTPVQEGLNAVETRLRMVAPKQHEELTAATEHLLNSGGKRMRPAISLLSSELAAADFDQAVSLAAAVEMLHTATLVHDDLIDGALLRRGIPTLNANWSPDATILTGDYLFARAASLASETSSVRVMDLFAKTLMTIVNGEITQKFSNDSPTSREMYFDRIYAKTASMFRLATEAAAIIGDVGEAAERALGEFGRQIGMAFQIVDDVLDFVSTSERIGKPVGGDLYQGLVTLPALCYFEENPDEPDVKAFNNGHMRDREVVARVVSAVRDTGAAEEALREAREYAQRAQSALSFFPDSSYTRALIASSDYIVNREL